MQEQKDEPVVKTGSVRRSRDTFSPAADHKFLQDQVVEHIEIKQEATVVMLIILHDIPIPVQSKSKTKETRMRCDCESSVYLNAIRSTVCQTVNPNARGSRTHQIVLVKHVVSSQKPLDSFQGSDEANSEDRCKNTVYITNNPDLTKEIREDANKAALAERCRLVAVWKVCSKARHLNQLLSGTV
jgi:hypothetical protein